jgi:hypothetical protein
MASSGQVPMPDYVSVARGGRRDPGVDLRIDPLVRDIPASSRRAIAGLFLVGERVREDGEGGRDASK